MATTTGSEYDHITISDGTDQTVHYLKDTAARADIDDLKSAFSTEINKVFSATDQLYFTEPSGALNGLNITKIDSTTISIYGTATAGRRLRLHNGHFQTSTTSSAFSEPELSAGLYDIAYSITGSYTGTLLIKYTYTTFANDVELQNGVMGFDNPAMLGIYVSGGSVIGSESNPVIISISAKKAYVTDTNAQTAISTIQNKYVHGNGSAGGTDDANNIVANVIYTLTSQVTNAPTGIGTLMNFRYDVDLTNSNRTGLVQIFVTSTNDMYHRVCWGSNGGSWTDWKRVLTEDDLDQIRSAYGNDNDNF